MSWSGPNHFGQVQIRLFWTNFYNLYLSKTIGPIGGQVLDSVFSRILFTLQASASSPSLANHFGMAASNSFFSISEDDPVNSSPTKTGTELVVKPKKDSVKLQKLLTAMF